MNQFKIISKSPAETKQIGTKLGRILKPGDVVGLIGNLGAGKTVMAKGIAEAFGINEKNIISPSFTIIAEYDTNPPLIHIDLYRIEREDEFYDLGIESFIGNDNITVIEWAEKAKAYLPDDIIKIYIHYLDENNREIILEGINEKDWDNR
ncbi:MAG: tRNA (adenosine(37)-N6)-threonylcarbamoyltransferase complex ATPase subunit type 1 TsaE [Nitrospirae bacterium]|jgi:tRNA threonylcarbamoyladenosine biosynthesis protein TsaE|nr:tRNA (adenosine(37)-N6)-threonylcarbamoyltransferase complex ATPase subunit type 1 TsaE [Nitrospirota bacterium]